MNKIKIIGAGLAGCEAAFQASRRGLSVTLCEMKPKKFSPAHKSSGFAELVCSNSLRSNDKNNAVGLLKEEMRMMGSLIIEAAEASSVPAGSALAVDRDKFSAYITEKIKNDPNITVIEDEITKIDENEITIVATGPLTSDALSEYIKNELGIEGLHFFDAAAPIVSAESIDLEKAYFYSRYGKGEMTDYLNCPMTKDEYDAFYEELISARVAELHDFDDDGGKITVFEGCMPVEVMAGRGRETLLFGPLKPVGLPDPKTGREPYAAVQLRRENVDGTMYNLVGFQTHLAFPEQKRVFSMIPGLENAEFLRYGVMHRNTYLNSPGVLAADYSMIKHPNIFFAGQITGVEGYVESAASGLYAGINAASRVLGERAVDLTSETMMGAMAHFVAEGSVSKNFQPMNANYGIVSPLGYKVRGGKAARNEEYSKRALAKLTSILNGEN